MLLEIKIHEQMIQKTEGILEGIFNCFWLHFGPHFGGNRLQKSIPKLNEKNAMLEGMFSEHATGWRDSHWQQDRPEV